MKINTLEILYAIETLQGKRDDFSIFSELSDTEIFTKLQLKEPITQIAYILWSIVDAIYEYQHAKRSMPNNFSDLAEKAFIFVLNLIALSNKNNLFSNNASCGEKLKITLWSLQKIYDYQVRLSLGSESPLKKPTNSSIEILKNRIKECDPKTKFLESFPKWRVTDMQALAKEELQYDSTLSQDQKNRAITCNGSIRTLHTKKSAAVNGIISKKVDLNDESLSLTKLLQSAIFTEATAKIQEIAQESCATEEKERILNNIIVLTRRLACGSLEPDKDNIARVFKELSDLIENHLLEIISLEQKDNLVEASFFLLIKLIEKKPEINQTAIAVLFFGQLAEKDQINETALKKSICADARKNAQLNIFKDTLLKLLDYAKNKAGFISQHSLNTLYKGLEKFNNARDFWEIVAGEAYESLHKDIEYYKEQQTNFKLFWEEGGQDNVLKKDDPRPHESKAPLVHTM